MRLLSRRQSAREETDEAVGRGLGWASIGIGLTEILAPRQVENLMGIGNGQHTRVLRVLGVREIIQGADILMHRDPTPGVWARAAGDMVDLACIGVAAKRTQRPGGFGTAVMMVLAIGALDMIFAARLAGDE